ncbi:SRPBCC domain-containing protein [Nesterenkonia muleiensis]|uniref:SRPBCC domain-containing protein n=1 Tax=Nesterenkonia muleiensis TaxID=2282648 RepID=UPI000E73EADF|nr:SRPBCC domain-containing protein [Nesterenkonia muleiensis]
MDTLEQFTRSLQGTAEEPSLVFERRYRSSPQDLWDAITTPERLARWFGAFEGNPPAAVGDDFRVDLGGGAEDMGRGTITACKSPVHLSYTWQWQNEDLSQVTADLAPDGDQTVLHLTHSKVEPAHVVGYGGGWEQCMLALDDELTGTNTYQSHFQNHETAANSIWLELQNS